MRSSRPSWRSVQASLVLLVALAAVAGVLAGCGTGSAPTSSVAAPTVTDAWVRVPAGAGQPAAGYFTMANVGGQADALLSVASSSATSCELHQTAMDSSGMTGMQMVDRIDLAAGATVKLEPGGYHVMLNGVGALAVGSKVELQLTFQHAGVIKVSAEVRAG